MLSFRSILILKRKAIIVVISTTFAACNTVRSSTLCRFTSLTFINNNNIRILRQQPSCYHPQTVLRSVVFQQQQEQQNFSSNMSQTTTTTETTTKIERTTTKEKKDVQSRLVYGKDDALFGYIEKQHNKMILKEQGTNTYSSSSSNNNNESNETSNDQQQQQPVLFANHILDAGTGIHSIRWIASLIYEQKVHQFTAITADKSMYNNCSKEIYDLGIEQYGTVLYGHWFPTTSSSTSTSTTSYNGNTNGHTNEKQQQQQDHHPYIIEQLQNSTFDVILVDYLIGAMDGFVPYQQDLILPQLLSMLLINKNTKSESKSSTSTATTTSRKSRLYIIGLQPIPDSVSTTEVEAILAKGQYPTLTSNSSSSSTTPNIETISISSSSLSMNKKSPILLLHDAMNLICKVRQVRDACILLAGQRCYREYPLDWILRQIEYYNNSYYCQQQQQQQQNHTNNTNTNNNDTNNTSHIVTCTSKQFPILYRHNTIVKQIAVGRSKLSSISNIHVRDSMKQLLLDLENESKHITSQISRIQLGYDYVVTVETK